MKVPTTAQATRPATITAVQKRWRALRPAHRRDFASADVWVAVKCAPHRRARRARPDTKCLSLKAISIGSQTTSIQTAPRNRLLNDFSEIICAFSSAREARGMPYRFGRFDQVSEAGADGPLAFRPAGRAFRKPKHLFGAHSNGRRASLTIAGAPMLGSPRREVVPLESVARQKGTRRRCREPVGISLAVLLEMRKLEARYYPPLAAAGSYVVVGHVVAETSETRQPRVEAAPELARHGAPATIIATLRHLVATTAPRSFERLASLRSRYWSFVLVAEETSHVQDA